MSEHIQQNSDLLKKEAQQTYPVQAGSIKKGNFCVLKGFPCKVIDCIIPAPLKNKAPKATITGHDIFNNKEYEETIPTSSMVQVPNIFRDQYEVADIDEDGFVSLVLPDGSLKENLKLPAQDEAICQALKKVWEEAQGDNVFFTVQKALKFQKIVSARIKLQ